MHALARVLVAVLLAVLALAALTPQPASATQYTISIYYNDGRARSFGFTEVTVWDTAGLLLSRANGTNVTLSSTNTSYLGVGGPSYYGADKAIDGNYGYRRTINLTATTSANVSSFPLAGWQANPNFTLVLDSATRPTNMTIHGLPTSFPAFRAYAWLSQARILFRSDDILASPSLCQINDASYTANCDGFYVRLVYVNDAPLDPIVIAVALGIVAIVVGAVVLVCLAGAAARRRVQQGHMQYPSPIGSPGGMVSPGGATSPIAYPYVGGPPPPGPYSSQAPQPQQSWGPAYPTGQASAMGYAPQPAPIYAPVPQPTMYQAAYSPSQPVYSPSQPAYVQSTYPLAQPIVYEAPPSAPGYYARQ